MTDFTARATFAPQATAPSRARSFARSALRAWGLPDEVVDDAVLLVSELVANGVQHAGTELEVQVRLDAAVSVEVQVTDQHPARALPSGTAPEADPDSERGRGLLLPSALAAAWGVTYTAAAKTVWFRLPVPGREDPAGAGGAQGAEGASPAGAAGDGSGRTPAGGQPGKKLPQRGLGNLDFDELVRRTVEAARDAVSADAAYALLADEDGELRVRAAVGIAAPELLTIPPGAVILSGGGDARSQLSVPFLVDGRVTGVLGVGAADGSAFSDEDSRRLQAVADRVAMSLERQRLSELERVRRGRVAFLAEASELLSTTLDQRQAIALTTQLIVPRLAAWCAVFLSEAADELRPAYVWHEDESRVDVLGRLLESLAPPSLPRVMASHGTSWSLAVAGGAGPDIARMASDAAWCFPLTARGRGLGMVVIGRPRGDRRWTDPPPRESLGLAEDLTRRAALALDNARLYERQQATSRALQHSLLPPELPVIPGVELAAEYEAAGEGNEVGGDFYDVFPVDDAFSDDADPRMGTDAERKATRWRFAIGDVCGTGPEAAAVTGLARNSLRIMAAEGHDITEVTRRLNQLILREGSRGRFITLLHGEIRLDEPEGPVHLSLVCAGHPPPLLLRAANGRGAGNAGPDGRALPYPAAGSQVLLGVTGDAYFTADEVSLYPGDVLLAVTDGVTERRDDSGRLLDDDGGLTRVLATCRGLSAVGVAARVSRAATDFGAEPSSDDMAILVLRADA